MADTPQDRTLAHRIVMWVLNAVLFFLVALLPAYLMAAFYTDSTVHYTFLGSVVVMMLLYWMASKSLLKRA